ncbi:MAG: glycine cleavage system protein R [Aestuariibacter sp.]
MKSLVLTIVGTDKPGLVESLAKLVFNHQGNWLASNFSHMAGQFAGFVEIHIPEDQEQAILDAFENHPNLKVCLSQGISENEQELQQISIDIVGNDKPGIVQEVTGVLNRFNLNIRKFDSSCGSAPNWGSALFKAHAQVTIPADVDTDELQHALEDIANDLMVEVKLS